MLKIDTKKLGRIVRPSHRMTGNQRVLVERAGWETLFVAIGDHARIAFIAMHRDEKKHEAVEFVHNAVGYYAGLGVRVKRLLTDNGVAFRSEEFAVACKALGAAQVHQTTPAADQRQGRAVYPVSATRVGLWLDVPELS